MGSGAVYACACQLRVEGAFWLPSVASGSASVFACWLRPDHVCQLPPVGSGAVYAGVRIYIIHIYNNLYINI